MLAIRHDRLFRQGALLVPTTAADRSLGKQNGWRLRPKQIAGLEIRRPANLFAPLGWLAASLLNPGGYFAYWVWGLAEFKVQLWAWHAVAPLQFGVAFAMMFLRQGGFGIGAVSFFVIICTLGACAMTGPIYTLVTYIFQQQNIAVGALGDLPILSFADGLLHAGSNVRLSLMFASVAIIPAIILLRILAFQRIPPRKPATAVTAPSSLL